MEGSKKYELNINDFKRIGVGALVAVGGAALTYIAQVITEIDFGQMAPVIVALASILVNAARKWIADYSKN